MKRAAGVALGVISLAVVAYTAMTYSTSESNLDRASYQKGYHAFGGAWLPPAEDERHITEMYCEQLWGEFPSDELAGVVKADWIDGCADYREGRDPRVSAG